MGAGGSFADGVFVAENKQTGESIDGTLHPFIGLTGGMVRLAQETVGVTVDGVLGPKTMAVVQRWQAGCELTVDVIPGADTYGAMKAGEALASVPGKPAAPAVPAGGTSVTAPKPYQQRRTSPCPAMEGPRRMTLKERLSLNPPMLIFR